MDKTWESKLLMAAERKDEQQEQEFIRLVEEAEGLITEDTAQILLKTFTEKPDYETQEIVISVLASGDERIVTTAILLELPRLIKEAPEWADCLLATEVEFRSELLLSLASGMPVEVKEAIISVLSGDDFREFHKKANELLLKLNDLL